jgi:hypothetical protein
MDPHKLGIDGWGVAQNPIGGHVALLGRERTEVGGWSGETAPKDTSFKDIDYTHVASNATVKLIAHSGTTVTCTETIHRINDDHPRKKSPVL